MTLLQVECHESSEDQTSLINAHSFSPQLPTNLIFINAEFKFTWAADNNDADKEEEKEQAADADIDSINSVRVENVGLYIDRYALLGSMKLFLISLLGIPQEHVTPIMDKIMSCGRGVAKKENPPKCICMKLKVHCHLERRASVDDVKKAFSKFLLHREMTSIKIPKNDVEEKTTITSCGICLEDMRAGTLVTRLTCLHFFHHRCISAWLAKSVTCPMCRHPGKRITIFTSDDLIAYLG